MPISKLIAPFFLLPLLSVQLSFAQTTSSVIGEGWANNSVNTIIFRKNSLVSYEGYQYAAYYNEGKKVVLAKRKLGSKEWFTKETDFKGKTEDAHNVISIMVDGEGYLHLAWDHHNNPLHYSRSLEPGSLEMASPTAMIGRDEKELSYPEFYKLPNGNILFFYRDGGSGRGDLIINKYDTGTKTWSRLQDNLISGERKRNAYWQAFIDTRGTLHISWVWRESPDVASNHDMCYARSIDGGHTWQKSNGEKYSLPITAATAEHALVIPPKSELINQTSMTTDKKGNPFIVSYWRDKNQQVPQYHLIYNLGNSWETIALDFRKTPFSLSGGGTKRIPISRPQVLVKGAGKNAGVLMLFRDEDRGSKASGLLMPTLKKKTWEIKDLSEENLGSWEPSFDTELWKEKHILNLFVQHTEQADGEGISEMKPQAIKVLEYKPKF
ncbi:BNR repeat-containing protein [Desertivirga arenae]|uniref:BNR repeat-containing protein n=1 Tax=Desertivirga arenae TaxID=2810309 RepID=UPI001A9683B5|nr:BNR repeat-containing protein [Pedobacter sp. SYSU D00823]